MQTDTQKYNESIKPNSKEIEILKKYFPQCFSKPATDENGTAIKEHFDTEKLAELLNKDEVDIKKEGFTLNFLGKSYARYQANLDSETVIVPDEQNAHIQSENVYIVGDNLDALQHLKYSYAEKIKCIYIDPPYNTGKEDFVYNDKFGFTAKDFVEKLDVTEEEAERICSMNGKCTHSAWLTFMYPRLALARELLRDDGVIFISIDDNEQANLKRLCDEVFGEGNFVACIAWQCLDTIKNDAKYFSDNHEYIFVYSKNIDLLKIQGIKKGEKQRNYYKNYDQDPRGDYLLTPLHAKSGSENSIYSFTFSNGQTWTPPKGTFPRFSKETLLKLEAENRLYLDPEGKKTPQKKTFFTEVGDRMPPVTFWDYSFFGSTRQSNNELSYLVGKGLFQNPKPSKTIEILIDLIENNTDAIILDFFSGSATTAHAVMQLNAQDGGSRKFIMVQLDEHVKKGSEAEKAGYKTIDEIGRERIRRAAEKIKSENPKTKADLGFKTFYLKSMPQNTLDKIKTFNPKSLFTSDGDIVKTLGEDTLFQTWQIKDGFGFNCNRQKIDIAGCTAYLLEDEKIGKYLYLLTGMEEKSVKELIRKIESFELTADKIFVYGYSFDFDALNSLSTNLKTLKNRNPLEPIIRY
ncbi:DNA methyltransferase [Treponema maltophilum]|uniref:site-specific DNA-methyltransferase n=1 Tax=Treponema maltophilum TaxID=51160 RepID=UPI003D8B635F